MLFKGCGICLVLSLVFGGGTHSGFFGDAAVQIIAIPLLCAVLWPAFEKEHRQKLNARLTLSVVLVCGAVLLIQLLPVPFDVWSGGEALLTKANLPGFTTPRADWSSSSLTPAATWAAASSLIPCLAVFGSAMQLSFQHRIALIGVMLAFGAVSLALGILQVTQGAGSSLRFYEMTNPTEAVGFFANRNHFAALLNVTLVLCAVWLAKTIEGPSLRRGARTRAILWFFGAAAFFVAIAAGLVMARSRAGVLLAMIALIGIAMMLRGRIPAEVSGESRPKDHKNRIILAIGVFAVLFALEAGLGGLVVRFDENALSDLRIPLAQTTLKTAVQTLPFGAGLGSFVRVYGAVEDKNDAVRAFANRAHNEVPEILLETGLVGVLLGGGFLIWFCKAAYKAWKRPKDSNDVGPVLLLNRASALVVLLMLLHSLVDYPLRTGAMAAIFAFFCALLAAPAQPAPAIPAKRRSLREKERKPTVMRIPNPDWGDETEWPEKWRKYSLSLRDAAIFKS